MTVYFSYISDLNDPDFRWDDPPSSASASNLPRRLVPADPLEDIGVSTSWMTNRAEANPQHCKRLDWGAWGMVLTGAALAEMFGSAHRHLDAISALDRDTAFVLVAGEVA